MIEDHEGGDVLVGGHTLLVDLLDTLFRLPHGGPDAMWIELEQKIKTGRYWHTAGLVTDSLVNCFSTWVPRNLKVMPKYFWVPPNICSLLLLVFMGIKVDVVKKWAKVFTLQEAI